MSLHRHLVVGLCLWFLVWPAVEFRAGAATCSEPVPAFMVSVRTPLLGPGLRRRVGVTLGMPAAVDSIEALGSFGLAHPRFRRSWSIQRTWDIARSIRRVVTIYELEQRFKGEWCAEVTIAARLGDTRDERCIAMACPPGRWLGCCVQAVAFRSPGHVARACGRGRPLERRP